MAWTTPLTAVANAALTAAQWNASVRDNLLTTAPALATTAGQIFAATGTNAIAARTPTTSVTLPAETTTSSTFTDIATVGPSVTVTTGTTALIAFNCRLNNGSASSFARAAVNISGASSYSPSVDYGLANGQTSIMNMGFCYLHNVVSPGALTPGSNTFKLQYRTDGTGTATFSSRTLTVVPF